MKRLILAPLLAVAFLLTPACESTLDYGYPVPTFDDDAVVNLFRLTDEAIANRDFPAYKSFFGPGYVAVDDTRGNRGHTYRADYLEMVESLFETAELLEVNTMVMDIDFLEGGSKAIARIQEEERRIQYGNTEHYTSLIDVEIGYDEGWIFIEKTTRTAMQVIED